MEEAQNGLIDLDQPHPGAGIYRTLQAYRCPICRGRTNLVKVFGDCGRLYWLSGRIEPICPDREEPWHRLLRAKIHLARKPYPALILVLLKAEIWWLRATHARDTVEGPAREGEPLPFPTYGIPTDPAVYPYDLSF